jgi:uncharacterized protein
MVMKSQKRFLTAEWINIIMLNYAVDPALLQPFVPRGTELDSFEGKTYLSLVGFEFNRTRISGISVPFHQAFEQVNLRFYVRRSSRRGVVFIRELVQRFAVAVVARMAFNENYSRVPMSHRHEFCAQGGIVEAEYAWGSEANRCSLRLETEESSFLPPEGSISQFITEHYWGYSAQPGNGCLEFEVQHPRWLIKNSNRADFSGNVVRLYGAEIAQTLALKPESAFLAEGSPVTIFKGKRIS